MNDSHPTLQAFLLSAAACMLRTISEHNKFDVTFDVGCMELMHFVSPPWVVDKFPLRADINKTHRPFKPRAPVGRVTERVNER